MAKNAEIRDESMFNERIVTRKNYQVKAGKNKRFELLGKANSGGSISGQEVLYIHHNNASHSAPRISFIPPKSVPEVVMHFSSIRNPSDHSANYSVNKLSQISTPVTGLQAAGTVRTKLSPALNSAIPPFVCILYRLEQQRLEVKVQQSRPDWRI